MILQNVLLKYLRLISWLPETCFSSFPFPMLTPNNKQKKLLLLVTMIMMMTTRRRYCKNKKIYKCCRKQNNSINKRKWRTRLWPGTPSHLSSLCRRHFSGCTAVGAWSWPLTAGVEVKDALIYTYTSWYTFILLSLVKRRHTTLHSWDKLLNNVI